MKVVFAEILIRKCSLVLMYSLDVIPLDSNSTKLVTQVWNFAFMWLYGMSKITFTKHLFNCHGTMFVRFKLHYNDLYFMWSSDNNFSRNYSCINITKKSQCCSQYPPPTPFPFGKRSRS